MLIIADRYDVPRLVQLCEEKLASLLWEYSEKVNENPEKIVNIEAELGFTMQEILAFAKVSLKE